MTLWPSTSQVSKADPLAHWRLCRNRKPRGEAVGFQSFRMRVFYIMGNRRLYKIEYFHMLGTPEPERLKVTALNLFHPTASPPCGKVSLFVLRHNVTAGRGVTIGDSYEVLETNSQTFCIRI
jgi:hypothetical protein